jgi:hypothetical protein
VPEGEVGTSSKYTLPVANESPSVGIPAHLTFQLLLNYIRIRVYPFTYLPVDTVPVKNNTSITASPVIVGFVETSTSTAPFTSQNHLVL